MQCGTPTCQQIWPPLVGAGKALGVKMKRIKAGSSAQEVTAAYDTAVAERPAVVVLSGTEPSLYAKQLKELQDDGTGIVSICLVTAEEYGIEAIQSGPKTVETAGELLAARAVVEGGAEAKIAYFGIPEISFTQDQQKAFERKLGELCKQCSAEYIEIPVTGLGTSAPDEVVSSLQKNPETEVAVFSAGDISEGLPAAMKAAGIDVKTLSYGANPVNLEYVANGEETAVLAIDYPVGSFTTLDQAARLITGQPLTEAESTGDPPVPPLQFLDQSEITFDPAKGWTGYPEFAERYATLWSGKEWTGK